MEEKVITSPVILDMLEPEFAYIDGEFKYRDAATGQFIADDVMEAYNQYYGYHGYDEENDEAEDCGDE